MMSPEVCRNGSRWFRAIELNTVGATNEVTVQSSLNVPRIPIMGATEEQGSRIVLTHIRFELALAAANAAGQLILESVQDPTGVPVRRSILKVRTINNATITREIAFPNGIMLPAREGLGVVAPTILNLRLVTIANPPVAINFDTAFPVISAFGMVTATGFHVPARGGGQYGYTGALVPTAAELTSN